MTDYVNLEFELRAATRNAAKLAEDVERYAKAAERYRTERDEWHAEARHRAERIEKLRESRDSARNLRDEYHEAYHQAEIERNTLNRENARLRSELAVAKETAAVRGDALVLRLAVSGGRAMTGPAAPAAAYRIAGDAVPHSTCDDCAEESISAALAALAAGGWLHDPVEVAALRAVADAARNIQHSPSFNIDLHDALDALDAAGSGAK